MPRSALSILGAVVLTATVSVTPVIATSQDQSPTTQGASSAAAVQIDRLAGPDRYATAAEIAKQWPGAVTQVYVVSGDNYHDALIAAARAGAQHAPVLLTKAQSLPDVTAQQLERLNPTQITVIGGTSAVSNSVINQLSEFAGSGGVERVAGSNAYDRSALVAAKYNSGRDRVFLASGEDYPDALSAAALAGAQHEPLLLTRRGSLPSTVATQLDRLNPREIVVLGGSAAVSDSVVSQVAAYATSGKARRVAGQDRYATSAAAAQEFPKGVDQTYVASGQNFADALVVSALAGREETAVVLTPSKKAAEGTIAAAQHLAPGQIFVAGGQVAVSDSAVAQIADAVGTAPVNPEPPTDPEPPVNPEPPAGEFPDEDTTGVPDGVTLTPSGGLSITKDGTVIDGLHVQGKIYIDADNVTIRNTLVETSTSAYPIHVENRTTGTLIENVEVDNLGGGGIAIFLHGSATVRGVDVHSAEDGIRINADDITVEDSYVHDLQRESGGHHDTIQIRRGDNVTIRGNNLQPYIAATDDPMNAAIQIGSLVGENQISNLLVTRNLMNGGNFTINGGGRQEVDSAVYSYNEFGRDFRYGVQGNIQNSVWEDTNVWHDTGKPAS